MLKANILSPEVLSHLSSLLIFGLWSYFSIVIAKKHHFFTLRRKTVSLKIPAIIFLWVFLALGVVQVIFSWLVQHFFLKNPSSKLFLLNIWVGSITILITSFLLPSSVKRTLWQKHQSWRQEIWIGVKAFFVAYPISLFFAHLIMLFLLFFTSFTLELQIPIKELQKALSSPFFFFLLSISLCSLVPLAEEFLFRGLLQSWVKNKLSRPLYAILISSLFFALAHYRAAQGISNIQILVTLFSVSIFLGILYEKYQSLFICSSLHACFNAFSILQVYLESKV